MRPGSRTRLSRRSRRSGGRVSLVRVRIPFVSYSASFLEFLRRFQLTGDGGVEFLQQTFAQLAELPARDGISAGTRTRQIDGDVGRHMAGADAQHDHASGQNQRLVHVVRHEKHGLLQGAAGLPDLEQHVLLARPGDGVECAERFVHEQDRRIHCQCACNGGALAHAAGKFAGEFASGVCQTDHRQVVVGDLSAFGAGKIRTGLLQCEDDIVGAGAPREEAVILAV